MMIKYQNILISKFHENFLKKNIKICNFQVLIYSPIQHKGWANTEIAPHTIIATPENWNSLLKNEENIENIKEENTIIATPENWNREFIVQK